MTTTLSSRWPVPPLDGYTVDDLFTLPDLPPHTQLIDGSLVFVSPQRLFHSTTIDLLVTGLRSTAPAEVKVRRQMETGVPFPVDVDISAEALAAL